MTMCNLARLGYIQDCQRRSQGAYHIIHGLGRLDRGEMEKEGGACFAVYILILDIQSIQVRPVLFTGWIVVPGHDETCESYCPFASRALLVPVAAPPT